MREDVASVVQRVLRDGPFSMRQLAEDAGLKYGVLRAWAMGRRTPTPENVVKIAEGMELRARKLVEFSAELRQVVKESERAH